MHILYNSTSHKVLNYGDQITREGEYFIIHKNKTKVKYPSVGLEAIILHNDNVKIEKGIPSIYDEKLDMVYSDPDYTGEEPTVEETDTPITEETPVEEIEEPMSIAEIRETVKWLKKTVDALLDVSNIVEKYR